MHFLPRASRLHRACLWVAKYACFAERRKVAPLLTLQNKGKMLEEGQKGWIRKGKTEKKDLKEGCYEAKSPRGRWKHTVFQALLFLFLLVGGGNKMNTWLVQK